MPPRIRPSQRRPRPSANTQRSTRPTITRNVAAPPPLGNPDDEYEDEGDKSEGEDGGNRSKRARVEGNETGEEQDNEDGRVEDDNIIDFQGDGDEQYDDEQEEEENDDTEGGLVGDPY